MSGERVKASDIPESEIIEAIRATRGRHGVPRWATTWDLHEHLSKYPPAVVQARLQSMIDRGVINGCACETKPPFCRGDFEIPNERAPGEFN